MKHKSKSTGFTLIEMLIVIAIIAILAGILLPVVSGARTAANRAKSVANVKAIMTGMLAHTQHDNKWLLPDVGFFGVGGIVPNQTPAALEPNAPLVEYIDGPKLWESPLDRGANPGAAGSAGASSYMENGSSYAYAAAPVKAIMGVRNQKMTKFAAATKKIIMFELHFQKNGATGTLARKDNWHNKRTLQGVCGYLDGHADNQKSDSTLSTPPTGTTAASLSGVLYY